MKGEMKSPRGAKWNNRRGTGEKEARGLWEGMYYYTIYNCPYLA